MTASSRDGVVVDAEGRRTAGRDVGALAREYRELHQKLDGILASGCGLADQEISLPYAELAVDLRERLAKIADDLEAAGATQLAMAANNDVARAADEVNINRVRQALG